MDVRKKILVFSWYMANQESIRETASVFGLSESTTYYAIKHTDEVICLVMGDVSTHEIFLLCVVMFPYHTTACCKDITTHNNCYFYVTVK